MYFVRRIIKSRGSTAHYEKLIFSFSQLIMISILNQRLCYKTFFFKFCLVLTESEE